MTQAIVELLDRNPVEWSEADLSALVDYLRQKREIFVKNKQAESMGGKKVRTSNPARSRADPAPDLDLPDLLLD